VTPFVEAAEADEPTDWDDQYMRFAMTKPRDVAHASGSAAWR
jgi:hypothetical protein